MEQVIGVWLSRVEKDFDVSSLLKFLDQEERARWQRLQHPSHRRCFVFGRYVLRQALSWMSQGHVPPSRWHFWQTANGQPLITGPADAPSLFFSLSYAGEMVALAVSRVGKIGIDIATLTDQESLDINAALSEWEQAWLAEQTPQNHTCNLLTIWTIKEAYAKMLGLGLHLDFSRLSVLPGPAPRLHDPCPPHKQHPYHLISKHLTVDGQNHVLSLAYEQGKAVM